MPSDSTTVTATAPAACEVLNVRGDDLLKSVQALAHEGRCRRITLCNAQGYTLFELPSVGGSVAELSGPLRIAIGALGGSADHFQLLVEREGEGR